jgi:hypothetical protein
MCFSDIMHVLLQADSTGRNVLSSLCMKHTQAVFLLNMSGRAKGKPSVGDVSRNTNFWNRALGTHARNYIRSKPTY